MLMESGSAGRRGTLVSWQMASHGGAALVGALIAVLLSKSLTHAQLVEGDVEAAEQLAGGVVGGHHGAASRLGLARTSLIYRMRKLGIPQRKNSEPANISSPRRVAYSMPMADPLGGSEIARASGSLKRIQEII